MKKLKVIFIALIVIISNVVVAQNNVLDRKISLKIGNATIPQILDKIIDDYEIPLSYSPDIFNKNKTSIDVKSMPLKKLLSELLGNKYTITTIGGQVSITKKEVNKKKKVQTIRGQIIDKESMQPLVGASVVVDGTNPPVGGITDYDGYYEIKQVQVGRIGITASFIGYKPVRMRNIMVLSAKQTVLDISMEETVTDLEEVVVTANNGKEEALNEMAFVGARSFNIEETEKFAGSWGDPSRMAANFAGVVMAGDERNDIVVRGNSPSALIWQLEGIPIPNPSHFDNLGAAGGPVSILNNNVLSRSDFLTGAFPAEYGNGYSGVFDLNMRNGNIGKYEFMGQIGFNGFEFGAEGPIFKKNNSSFIINGRYSMLGLVDELLWVGGLPYYQDISYKINMPYNKGTVELFGFGGLSHISFETGVDNSINENHWYYEDVEGSKTLFSGIKHTHFISNSTRIENAFAYSTRRPYAVEIYYINNEKSETLDDYEDKESKLIFSSKLVSKLNAKNTVQVGLRLENSEFSHIEYNNLVRNDSLIPVLDGKFSQNNLNLINSYANIRHKFTDEFSINTGVHYQNFLYNNTYVVEPRFGLKYSFRNKSKIGAGYGMHCQMQPLYTYFLANENGEVTNKNLDFTKSHQFVVSYGHLFGKNLHFKAEIYYQHIYDVPVKEDVGYLSMLNYGYSDNIKWIEGLKNEGTGKNIGIDLTFEKFFVDGYYFLVTASLFDSKYKGWDKIERNTTYNGNYVFNGLAGYEFNLGKNCMLNLNFRNVYAGGMRYIPYDIESSIAQGYPVQDIGKVYGPKVKDYFRIDFRVGLVVQGKRFSHEFALDITNVTDNANELSRFYDGVSQGVVKTYQQGIFPMGLYRINF